MEFQEKLIKALITSPTEFNNFKRNNRKYVPYIHTYLRKLLPEEMIKNGKNVIYIPNMNEEQISWRDLQFTTVYELQQFIMARTRYSFYDFVDEFSIKMGVPNRLTLKLLPKNPAHAVVFKSICRLIDFSNLRNLIKFDNNRMAITAIYNCAGWGLDRYNVDNMSIVFDTISEWRYGIVNSFILELPKECNYIDMHKLYLSYAFLQTILFKEEYEKTYQKGTMTFGIELEYYQKRHMVHLKNKTVRGIRTKQMLYKKTNYKHLLKKGILSYNVGWDGHSTTRLNENRIRINGLKGLTGFYQIINEMRKTTCLTNQSSIHIHLDHRYNNTYRDIALDLDDYSYQYSLLDSIFKKDINENTLSFEEKRLVHEGFREQYRCGVIAHTLYLDVLKRLSVPDIWQSVLTFFGEDKTSVDRLLTFVVNIRRNNAFQTVEYRMFTPTFDYSRIVAELLIAIQIDRTVTRGTTLNENIVRSIINAFNNRQG